MFHKLLKNRSKKILFSKDQRNIHGIHVQISRKRYSKKSKVIGVMNKEPNTIILAETSELKPQAVHTPCD